MKIQAWRIVKAKHAGAAFSGAGAKEFGGRWNSPGVAMVYTAGSISLAQLELLVHLDHQEILNRYVLFEVEFDKQLVTSIERESLPKSWRRSPAPKSLQRIGVEWIRGATSPVLKVPSAVVPHEWNYLLNPQHADFAQIGIGAKEVVKFDPRLLKQS